MSTAVLIGLSSPGLTSLASILRSLDCHVLRAGAAGAFHRTIRYDLTVTEYRPQEMSGEQVRETLHALGDVPRIVIGPDLPARQTSAFQQCGAAYLSVNSSGSEKRAVVRSRLPDVHPLALRVGRLQLNVADGQVHYGSESMSLTSTEFRLLSVLMHQPGQTFDCETLEAVSECRDAPTHLGNLRRKISACSQLPLLRGNRQQGYAIDARHHPRTQRNAAFALRNHLLHLI